MNVFASTDLYIGTVSSKEVEKSNKMKSKQQSNSKEKNSFLLIIVTPLMLMAALQLRTQASRVI